ncbi:tail fiber domain-containing protein [bacterium]|nr:tail fiber domain-containing protein [bacterium]MDC3317679.1 tail fiber domain-containing protein [bacterium]
MAITLDGSNGITTPGGATTDDITFADNDKAIFGAGSDLQIYHDGSNSLIKDNGTGKLIIDTDGTAIEFQKSGLETLATFATDGAVTLYHDNAQKFATTATGIDITGKVTSDELTVASGVNTETRTLLVDNAHSGGSMYNAFGVYVGGTDRKVTLSADYGDSVMAFKTNGVERMKISPSGNIGINGDPDSGRKLHIEGGDTTVGITLKDTAGGQFGIYSEDGNLDFKSDSANTVRMRIRGDGNIDIGSFSTTGASDGVQINPTGSGARSSSDATGFSYHYRFYNPNGQCGYIMTNGSATSFVTSSDYRLKENVVDLTGASARVNQLNPSRFNFIADGTDTVVDGFIAHEVATVVPEAIAGTHNEVEVWKDDEELPDGVSVGDNKLDDDGNTIPVYQGIDQSKLVPLLTAALQEALTEIASLKTRVEALEA